MDRLFNWNWTFAAVLALVVGPLRAAQPPKSKEPKEPTAFELVKKGNEYVGKQARGKVVEIRSEKSIAELNPTIWYVVYYDRTATFHATEVKFGGGKMMTVKRPWRLLEPLMGDDRPLDQDKLKIDSDKAIQIAVRQPLLSRLKITATRLKLTHGEDGAGPVWEVRLWASKLKHPDRDVDLGTLTLSATDGEVLENDLHIERVD